MAGRWKLGLTLADGELVSCIRLPIVRAERRSAVAAAVVLLLTVSTLPLHIGPKQFSNTLVMMILTHCLWAGIL